MGDLFFIIKAFFITLFIVILMQIKIGDLTVEEHSQEWISESEIGGYLTEIAQGLVYFTGQSFKQVRGTMNNKFTELIDRENSPGLRQMKFHMKRSEEFIQDKVEQVKQHKAKVDQSIQHGVE